MEAMGGGPPTWLCRASLSWLWPGEGGWGCLAHICLRDQPLRPSWGQELVEAPRPWLGPPGAHQVREVGWWEGTGAAAVTPSSVQGTNGSQIWDTAFAIQALLEVRGSAPRSPASTTPAPSRAWHPLALTLCPPGL